MRFPDPGRVVPNAGGVVPNLGGGFLDPGGVVPNAGGVVPNTSRVVSEPGIRVKLSRILLELSRIRWSCPGSVFDKYKKDNKAYIISSIRRKKKMDRKDKERKF